jgi:DNA repair photolyase
MATAKTPPQIVISASRRTDIPAFYLDWFMDRVESGYFEAINPYSRKVSIVSVTPEMVHSIVFWSKNFGPFLSRDIGEQLQKKGFHLFFNFTINSDSPRLEPLVPVLSERLRQLENLSNRFDSRAINWRFDPVCFYKINKGSIKNNLQDFDRIAAKAAQCGISRCITSFMDDYSKIRKRVKSITGFSFIYPSPDKKMGILQEMKKKLRRDNIRLYTCCEKELLDRLPANAGIESSACVPNDLLVELYGGNLSVKTDHGQRIKKGCGCKVSIDIGSYPLHPCYHSCLFCYANPAADNNTLFQMKPQISQTNTDFNED